MNPGSLVLESILSVLFSVANPAPFTDRAKRLLTLLRVDVGIRQGQRSGGGGGREMPFSHAELAFLFLSWSHLFQLPHLSIEMLMKTHKHCHVKSTGILEYQSVIWI